MQPVIMDPPCAVGSPILAAGMPPISTDADPDMIVAGGPVQLAISPILEAGIPPISTVGSPGGIKGPPAWAVPVTIGHTCMSLILAAGCAILYVLVDLYQ